MEMSYNEYMIRASISTCILLYKMPDQLNLKYSKYYVEFESDVYKLDPIRDLYYSIYPYNVKYIKDISVDDSMDTRYLIYDKPIYKFTNPFYNRYHFLATELDEVKDRPSEIRLPTYYHESTPNDIVDVKSEYINKRKLIWLRLFNEYKSIVDLYIKRFPDKYKFYQDINK